MTEARIPREHPGDPAPDGFEAEAPLRRRREPRPLTRGRQGLTRGLRFAALGAFTAGVVLAVYVSGLTPPAATGAAMPPGHPDVAASALPAVVPSLDAAQAAALAAKAAANPGDTDTLTALARLYAEAGEWQDAASWQGRLAQAKPADTDVALILGVYQFNAGDLAAAERTWEGIVGTDPAKAEAWYDLGFLYLGKSPAEPDRARAAWQKVIDLAPGTALADTVANHLSALSTASPAPAAAPTKG